MSQWDLQSNEISLYFKNTVNDSVVCDVQKAIKSGKDTIYVSFDVTGRTRHMMLSYQLKDKLAAIYGPKVNIEVGYNYQCVVRWVSEVIKEQPTAYDIDKVVEEFDKKKKKYNNSLWIKGNEEFSITRNELIEIVKQDGVGKDVE